MKELIELHKSNKFIEVIKLAPKYFDTHFKDILFLNLLGTSHFSIGEYDKSINFFIKALNINKNDINILSNLGSAYYQKNEHLKSKEYFKNVISIDPNNFYALNMIGNSLFVEKNIDESILYLNKSIEINPKNSDAFNTLGLIFELKKDYKKAKEMWNNSLDTNPSNFNAKNNLGSLSLKINDIDTALLYFKEALKINPHFTEAYSNIGTTYIKIGYYQKAFENFKRALDLNFNHLNSLINLSNILRYIKLENFNNDYIERLINKILDTETYSKPKYIAPFAIQLIKNNKLFINIEKNIETMDINNVFQDLSKILILIKLFRLCPLPDLRVESLLTKLRHKTIIHLDQIDNVEINFFVLESISINFFITEYVIPITDEENTHLNLLSNKVSNEIQNNSPSLNKIILVISLYQRLTNLSWHKKIISNPTIQLLIKLHIDDYYLEQKIKSDINSFSSIINETSNKVKDQYEINPYPRWQTIVLSNHQKSLDEFLIEKNLNFKIFKKINFDNPKVLVAGCGTGQHTLSVQSSYLNADITCIDLSTSSIAYAKRKILEYNLPNIKFFHCDILNLEKFPYFDYDLIESSGVIHHMESPNIGLKLLVSKLKQGGFLKLGLYSRIARQSVINFRDSFSNSFDDLSSHQIKRIRQSLIEKKLDKFSNLFLWSDFYSLSEFRDLLLHAKEHQYSCIDIKNLLSEEKLEFIGFELSNTSIYRKFIDLYGEDSKSDLLKWHEFEKNNNNIFAGMYQFWCQKT